MTRLYVEVLEVWSEFPRLLHFLHLLSAIRLVTDHPDQWYSIGDQSLTCLLFFFCFFDPDMPLPGCFDACFFFGAADAGEVHVCGTLGTGRQV